MEMYQLRSYEEFIQFQKSTADEYATHLKDIEEFKPKKQKILVIPGFTSALQQEAMAREQFYISGYSYPAKKNVNFMCNFFASPGYWKMNWRESLWCPITRLNNRMRAAVHFSHIFLNIHHSSKFAHKSDDPSFKIYIMEQVTHLYTYCQTLYPHIIGSEFLGDKVKLGATDERGIRNEDARCLSFPNNALDAILSFEVLEHVPDFQRVFIECLRTLKPGGILLFTAPFTLESPNNTIRAEVNSDGSLTHHLPEEYHGDPNNNKSILCYHYFGWEVLHHLRKLGFRDAFVNTFWSIELGYFTRQVQVVAIK